MCEEKALLQLGIIAGKTRWINKAFFPTLMGKNFIRRKKIYPVMQMMSGTEAIACIL